MGADKKPRRALKICCSVSAILLIAFLVAAVVLFLTILKPKQPRIVTNEVTLEYIKWVPLFDVNVTLGVKVTIDNRNYASYKYENSSARVSYRGNFVAEAPIQADKIPARGKHEVATTVKVIGENLISNPYFGPDLVSGCLNFTSSTTLHGEARVLKLLKVKATTTTTCDISIYVVAQNASSSCRSKVKY
ncbi:uncharacterized protein LOC127794739 [Diospyros lotus]|uniref:uncharacterized protein LOC127794739 n=1 Tax=Diospyros lotus TaxID=55363 RepID=UPI00225C3498|nr:uncharacterized protein LOC127794739 [Diospyros lotus]